MHQVCVCYGPTGRGTRTVCVCIAQASDKQTNKQTAQGARRTQTHKTDALETEGQPQTQTQRGE
eukprot:7007900-Prymnesium_polylepis.1